MIQNQEEQPELKDIVEMLKRYVEANKKNVAFIGGFLAFKPGKCECCKEEDANMIREDASRLVAYGDLETLRILLNDLRDLAEDEVDEEGFINV